MSGGSGGGGGSGGDLGGGRLELVTQAIASKLRVENAKLLDQHAEAFQEKVLEALMVVLNDEDVLGHLASRTRSGSSNGNGGGDDDGARGLGGADTDASAAEADAGGRQSGRRRTKSSGRLKPLAPSPRQQQPKPRHPRVKKKPKPRERFEGAHPLKPVRSKQTGTSGTGGGRGRKVGAGMKSSASTPPSSSSAAADHDDAPDSESRVQRASSANPVTRSPVTSSSSPPLPRKARDALPPLRAASAQTRRPVENAESGARVNATGDEVDEEAADLLAETRAMLRSMGIEPQDDGESPPAAAGTGTGDVRSTRSSASTATTVSRGKSTSPQSRTVRAAAAASAANSKRRGARGGGGGGGGGVGVGVGGGAKKVAAPSQATLLRSRKKAEVLAAAKARQRQQLAMIGDLQLPAQAETGQLPESEWENEIAKSILSIYHANLRRQIEEEAEAERKEAERRAEQDSAAAAAAAEGNRLRQQHETAAAGGGGRGKKKKRKTKKVPPPPPAPRRGGGGGGGGGGSAGAARQLGATFKANTISTQHLAAAKDAIVHGRFDTKLPGRGPAYGGKVLRRYRRPMIWFGGSGKVKAVWCALAVEALDDRSRGGGGGDGNGGGVGGGGDGEGAGEDGNGNAMGSGCGMTFCNELAKLEKKGKYSKYIALVEGKLRAEIFRLGPSLVFDRLWRQLVVTAAVFGYRCCESGDFGAALKLLRHAQEVIEKEDAILTIVGTVEYEHLRRELFAYVFDIFAFYYLKRDKSATAVQYAKKALACHRAMGQPHQIAKCKLHIASAQARARDHKAALVTLGEILKMVDDGRLETAGTSAEKICLVAVCYHNIAVQQLYLERFDEACVASQNCRRLARISLSYSNRWLPQFDATHRMALTALSESRAVRNNFTDEEQAQLFRDLAAQLFSDDPNHR